MTEHFVEICYSDDNGNNWSNWRTVDVGTVGSFAHKFRIRRLGSTFTRIWKQRDTSRYKGDLVACSVKADTQ